MMHWPKPTECTRLSQNGNSGCWWCISVASLIITNVHSGGDVDGGKAVCRKEGSKESRGILHTFCSFARKLKTTLKNKTFFFFLMEEGWNGAGRIWDLSKWATLSFICWAFVYWKPTWARHGVQCGCTEGIKCRGLGCRQMFTRSQINKQGYWREWQALWRT